MSRHRSSIRTLTGGLSVNERVRRSALGLVPLAMVVASFGVLVAPVQAAGVACPSGWTAGATDCSMTVAYSGAQTTVAIPAGATDLGVELAGAQGGTPTDAFSNSPGGKGGKVAGRLAGAGGSTLTVLVGGQGRQTLTNGTTATVGGGGRSGLEGASGGGDASGGGGTFLAKGNTLIAVAGGGGAGGDGDGHPGGAGSGTGQGGNGTTYQGAYQGAKGGTTSGGAGASRGGGTGTGPATVTNSTIVPGAGGYGGDAAPGNSDGAGGGGGYAGGGGGYLENSGAGGSGYSAGLSGTITNESTLSGNTGNGYLKLSYVPADEPSGPTQSSYELSTIAGTGTNGAPTPGPATASMLKAPFGVAVDGSGNVYIVDTDNHRVLKLTPSDGGYVLSVIAGTGLSGAPTAGPATSSKLNGPSGVAVDGSGNVYVADTSNNRIEKLTPSDGGYVLSVIAGTGLGGAPTAGPATSSRLRNPSGVAVDGSGNVYVADTSNSRIEKLTSSGGAYTLSVIAGSGSSGAPTEGPATLSALNGPRGVAVDGSGNVYVADSNNYRVEKLTPSADGYVLSVIAGTGSLGVPTAGQATSSALNTPGGVAVDGSGNVYVADTGNSQVGKLTPSAGGYVLSVIAGTGTAGAPTAGPATSSMLNFPRGVAVDGSGNVYVADASNYRVEKLSIVSPLTAQTITYTGPTTGTAGGTGTLTATGGASGNPVTFSVKTGSESVCSLSGTNNSTVTYLTAGTCVVKADQAGTGGTYEAASTVEATVTVTDPNALSVGCTNLNDPAWDSTYTGSSNVTGAPSRTAAYGPNEVAVITATLSGKGATASYSARAVLENSSSGGTAVGEWVGPAFVARATTVVAPLSATYDATHTFGWTLRQSGGATQDMAIWTVKCGKDLNGNSIIDSEEVTKTPVTITADNLSKTYGEVDPAPTYTVTGLDAGDSLTKNPSCTRVAGENVGTKTVTCSGAEAASKYEITYVNGSLTINKRALTVTPTGQSVTYGDANPSSYPYAVTGGSLFGDDSLTGSCGVTGTPKNAGTYPITCDVSAGGNYTVTVGAANLTIAKKDGVVTPDPQQVTYGDGDPDFTYSVSGLNAGDSLTSNPTCGVTGSYVNAGEYTITCTGGSSDNYTLDTSKTATLKVLKKNVAVNADNATKVYGADDPTFTGTAVGLLDDESATVSCGVTGAHSNVGTYPITCTGNAGPNYNVGAGVTGSLVVTKAALTLTADNKTRTTAQANPTLTYTTSGLVNGDTAATAFSGAPSLSTTATTASPVGVYPISISAGTVDSANYTVSYVAGSLSVTTAGPPVKPTPTLSPGALVITTANKGKTIKSISVSATLKNNGAAVAGKTVTFTVPGITLCTAKTNASGVATCNIGVIRAAAILFHGGYTATFAGDATYNKTSVFSRNVKVV